MSEIRNIPCPYCNGRGYFRVLDHYEDGTDSFGGNYRRAVYREGEQCRTCNGYGGWIQYPPDTIPPRKPDEPEPQSAA